METLTQDVRHGIRFLASSPGFVAISVLCLGLGIGANTTLFSVVSGLLLQAVPFPDPHRLVILSEVHLASAQDAGRVSYPNFRDWREHAAAVAGMAALRARAIGLSNEGVRERYSAAHITWDLFPMLGVQPIAGRGFREDEDRPGAAPVVLLSEGLWHQRYAADPAAIGKPITIDGRSHAVIGVMPRFVHPGLPGALREARVWLPLTPLEHASPRDERALLVYARLAEGVEAGDARDRLTSMAAALEAQHAENRGWGVTLRDASAPLSATNRALITVMMGAVGFVLLIACANVATLVLARATRRRREIAVRIALGASRSRIVRQLLSESLMVGLLSVLVGLAIASWGIDLLLQASPGQSTNVVLRIDPRVVAFTIGLGLLTSLIFGLAPALHATRGAARDALSDSGHQSTGGRQQKHLRNALVVSEVALTLILLVGAALFVRSFMQLMRADTGIEVSSLLTLRVDMPGDRAESSDAMVRRLDEVMRRLEALPGVASVAASNLLPLRDAGERVVIDIDRQDSSGSGATSILYGSVTAEFFETVSAPIFQGRHFTDAEERSGATVAIVNQRMAERVWPGQDAVGRRFRLARDPDATWFTVIGISRDIANWDISDRPQPTAYLPYPHAPAREPRLLIQTAGDPLLLAAAVQAAVQEVDAGIVVFELQSLEQVHRLAFWRQELFGRLLTVFGGVALLMAAVGLYGVLSFLVSQRTREIGVRMAIGAGRRDVMRLILWQGMTLVAGGVGVGLAGAFLVTRLLRRYLHEVSATDPVSFAAVAVLLVCIGLLASYAPAHRAAGVDPLTSIRE